MDIPLEASQKQPMRITYFRCLGEPSPDEPAPCPSDIVKGNMNVPENCTPPRDMIRGGVPSRPGSPTWYTPAFYWLPPSP